jgi:hypothetical protein
MGGQILRCAQDDIAFDGIAFYDAASDHIAFDDSDDVASFLTDLNSAYAMTCITASKENSPCIEA